MKYKFLQHVPPFVSGVEPKVFQFESLDELLNKYESEVQELAPGFRYVYGDHKGETRLLMSINYRNDKWYVLGYTDYPLENDLPYINEERKR